MKKPRTLAESLEMSEREMKSIVPMSKGAQPSLHLALA